METRKTIRKRRKYDADFKTEVLKMLENGQGAARISEKLGMGENLVYRWKKQAAEQKAEKPVSSESSLLEQVERLQKELRRVETERDILKKAVAIFSAFP